MPSSHPPSKLLHISALLTPLTRGAVRSAGTRISMTVKNWCQGWCFRAPLTRDCGRGSASAVPSPADPSGHREQVTIRVVCPPGGPPAPAAVLGGCPPAKAPPGSQAQRASPTPGPHALTCPCSGLSLRHVPPCTLAKRGGSMACAGVAQNQPCQCQSIPGHRLWLSGSCVGIDPSCCRGSTSFSWQESGQQSNPAPSPLSSSDKGRQEEGQRWAVGHKGCGAVSFEGRLLVAPTPTPRAPGAA